MKNCRHENVWSSKEMMENIIFSEKAKFKYVFQLLRYFVIQYLSKEFVIWSLHPNGSISVIHKKATEHIK